MSKVKKTETVEEFLARGGKINKVNQVSDIYKDKKTNYERTISLSEEEINEIRDGTYTAFRITVTKTGEVYTTRSISKILDDAKRMPLRCEDTGRFLGFTSYFVAKFR